MNAYWVDPAFSNFKVLINFRLQAELENLTRFNMVDFYISLTDEKNFTGLETIKYKTEPGILLRQSSSAWKDLKRVIALRDELCRLPGSADQIAHDAATVRLDKSGSSFFDIISEARVSDSTAALVPESVLKNLPDLADGWSVQSTNFTFTHYLTFSTLNDNANFSTLLRGLKKGSLHASTI